MKANNIVRVSSSPGLSFFKQWLAVLTPFHHLTEREIQLTASILNRRHILSKVIKDDGILDKVVMDDEGVNIIKDECGFSMSYLRVSLTNLRKKKVFIEGRINPKFIPAIEEGSDNFCLLFHFDLTQ